MPGLAPLLTAALAGAATPANPPALDGQWCADVTETLTVDGVKEPVSTNAYNLCLDTTGIRWSQAQAPEGAGYSIFNGTDCRLIDCARAHRNAPRTASLPV